MKQKKRLSRRFMAFLLTAVLVFSSLSLSAFAESSGDESADAEDAVAAAEETVTATEEEAAAETEESAEEAVTAVESDETATVDDESSTPDSSVTISSSNIADYITSTTDVTSYAALEGYYYLVDGTYYPVYYTMTVQTVPSTEYIYYLYYLDGSEYKTITTINGMGNQNNTATLYYYSTSGDDSDDDDDDDEDSESTSIGELNAAAYRSSALVYWDLNDSSESKSTESNYISSVTLGSTSTTDETTGETTETAKSVSFFESTSSNFGTADSNFTWDSSDAGTSTVSLDDVYDTKDGYGSKDDLATLTITPATGYYVTSVTITCSAYVPSVTWENDEATTTYIRVSPYACKTYENENAYEGTFTLSNASGSALTLSVDIDSLEFSHDGYTLSSYKTNESGETLYYSLDTDGTVNYDSTTTTDTGYPVYGDDDVQAVYFVLIEVAEIPTPAYVEYDFGEIVNYISAYNTENNLDSTDEGYLSYTAFSTASGWTDEATDNGTTKNVYNGTGTTTGGVLTNDTQYQYAYDKSSNATGYNSWVHYTNTISETAVKEAAAAGYVFAGWAVTYYSTATATQNSGSNGYNNYSIVFSDASTNYTTLVLEDTSLTIIGNVRLVAQWVKADDFTQVIDYGLPVSLDIIEELDNALTLQALISSISSRSSVTQNLYEDFTDSDYVTLSTDASIAYEVTTSTTSTDDEGNESTSTSTDYKDAADGKYGAFSVNTDGDAVYTLSEQMTGVESMTYQVSLTYTSGSGSSATSTVVAQPTGTISIVPATSMYYEENFGTSTTSSDGKEISYGLITYSNQTTKWTATGTAASDYQETGLVGDDEDSTYGTDAVYLSELSDSYGTSMCVNTTSAAAQFSYTFTGTGTTIYSRTSTDSAYIRVYISGTSDDGTSVSHTEFIDTRVIKDTETYSSGTDGTTLYGIPVYDYTDLDYGTYTVTVLVYKAGTTVGGWYETDEDGDETLVNGSDKSGAYFYLDGIRIYNPINPDEEDSTSVNDSYNYVSDVYEADGENDMFLINVYEQLAVQEDDSSASSGFVTITDTDENITNYDTYFDIGPNNEVYLWNSSSSTDGETGETSTSSYSVTFYVLYGSSDEDDNNSGSDTDFDIYIGMKSPLGTASSVKIGSDSTATTLGNSPDCYYEVTGVISSLTVNSGSVSAMKVTITGVSGLAALSYIKVVGAENVESAYNIDVEEENELDKDTVYLVSVAGYEALVSDADTDNDSDTDGEEDGDDQTDSEDGDKDDTDPEVEDDTDTEDENDSDVEDEDDTEEESAEVFTPEKFEASISYLKLLKYATITVKASSDVSYITVNEEEVTGRTMFGTTSYSYSALKVSSGTTYEVIAYDADGNASEAIVLTAK